MFSRDGGVYGRKRSHARIDRTNRDASISFACVAPFGSNSGSVRLSRAKLLRDSDRGYAAYRRIQAFVHVFHAPSLYSQHRSGAWADRKMVATDGAGQQRQTDSADVETTAETLERQNQEAGSRGGSSRGGSSRGGSSRGGSSRGGAVAGVRSGGGTGEGEADGNLEDEAAVGSIHHILKTAFKELYGGGVDKEEGDKGQSAEAETVGNREGVSAGASGSESGRRSHSSTAETTTAEGEGGYMIAV